MRKAALVAEAAGRAFSRRDRCITDENQASQMPSIRRQGHLLRVVDVVYAAQQDAQQSWRHGRLVRYANRCLPEQCLFDACKKQRAWRQAVFRGCEPEITERLKIALQSKDLSEGETGCVNFSSAGEVRKLARRSRNDLEAACVAWPVKVKRSSA